MLNGRVRAFIVAPPRLRQKLNYLRYRFSRPAERLGYRPVTLSVVVTGRCNLRCAMCHTHSPAVPPDYRYRQTTRTDIDLATFREVVARFPDAVGVSLIGAGEPLLNPDFPAIVGYAARVARMRVSTTTNGVRLEAEAEQLAASGIAALAVSLNGFDAASFARLTGQEPGLFARIEAGFRRLVAARERQRVRLVIAAQYIVDRENLADVPAMAAHGLGLGADRVHFSSFLPAPFPGLSAPERTPGVADRKHLDTAIAALARLTPAQRARLDPPLLLEQLRGAPRCRVHFSQLRVDGEGNVGSCSAMLQNISGHGTFRDTDVWNGDWFRRQRRAFLGGEHALEEPCRVCPYNYGVPAW